ncbi:MAG: hypothetical protein R3B93_14200 [Bacteroidia bacterium]
MMNKKALRQKRIKRFLKNHDKKLKIQQRKKHKAFLKRVVRHRPGGNTWPSKVGGKEPSLLGSKIERKPNPKQFDKEPDREEIREIKKRALARSKKTTEKANQRIQQNKQKKIENQINRIKSKQLGKGHSLER